MITKKLFKFISLVLFTGVAMTAAAQGTDGVSTYYQTANGKSGTDLKTALCKITTEGHEQLDYKELWDAFTKTDLRSDEKIWDMYSNVTDYEAVTQGKNSYKFEGDGYNREHSFPNSWFGGKVYPMYTDLHHIYPTDAWVNNKRGNNPFGETDGESYKSANDFSKLGTCTTEGYNGVVFEPADEYKGDFARAYFYMATRYENEIAGWSSNKDTEMLSGDSYTAYTDWAMKMLLRWSAADPVSKKETDRNEAVYSLQKNRNPYIDSPGLEQYVWGDKKNEPYYFPDATSIQCLEVETQPVDIYRIDGVRVGDGNHVDKLPKGIYIKGNKKIIIK